MALDLTAAGEWLRPDWAVTGVHALTTTRRGGVSAPPFDSFNLRDGVGDAPEAVAHNLRLLTAALGAPPVLLDQVHGARVVRLTPADLASNAPPHAADASVSTDPALACAVLVADCLPVLFVARGARAAVAAAHAGWRGLATGVLEATLAVLRDAAGGSTVRVTAWLGPCIGPRHFEVGADVLHAFGADDGDPAFEGLGAGKWLADLPRLARGRLHAAGVTHVGGGLWCTYADSERFYSYRRDGRTGRMVAAIRLTGV